MNIRLPDIAQTSPMTPPLHPFFPTSSVSVEASAVPPLAVAVVELKQKSAALRYQYSARIAARHEMRRAPS